MIRRFVELASRGRSIRRRLPPRYGKRRIVVSPDAALRWLKPGQDAFESSLLSLADHWVKPGTCVWDIGANVGAFGFPAAHRSGAPAILVEADPFLAGLLRRSAALSDNSDLDVRVLGAAIGERNGTAEFAIAGRGRASNALVAGGFHTQHGKSRQVITVPVLTLDTLLKTLPAPDLVKVDVEGAEHMLLRGSAELLREVRPNLYIEISSANFAECSAILGAADYRLFDGDADLASPVAASGPVGNALAVPAERAPGG